MEFEHFRGDVEADFPAFSCSQMDALETFQFLDRARDAGNHITDIELNYLVGITAARIFTLMVAVIFQSSILT